MPARPSRIVAAAALGGVAFALVECLAAVAAPAPLDGPLTVGSAALALAGGALLHASLTAPFVRRLGVRALLVPVVAWALVWGPEGPRAAGAVIAWGLLPAALLGGLGALRPRAALFAAALGGLWVPTWRPRWTGVDAAPEAQPDGPDLLLITVDTTRADAGLWPVDAPGWAHYTRAVSPAPWTLPAMHSLFSGASVEAHGGGLPTDGGWTRRRPGHPSLVSALRAAGYATIGLASNPHLGASQGFADGFSRWTHAGRDREPFVLLHNLDGQRARLGGAIERRRRHRDARLVGAALAELRAPSDRPRFVWVHLMRPHEYRRDAERPPAGWSAGTDDADALRAAYAGNVAATRARVAALVAAADGWTVALTSDHGEALGESGRWGHGHRLWDPELRVPLAVRVAGRPGGVVDAPVSPADLLPALLAHADGAPDVALPPRAAVPVAGLRSAAVAATWTPGGVGPLRYLAADGGAVRLDAYDRAALEALGYVVPEATAPSKSGRTGRSASQR